ncbi:MAG: UDP-3-O-(3-hydroxymyristoyl)glucosamine N-acyltransferase [Elusimicrobia bacterium GWA2_61_42]|nr:MAG: UDP-3-O-(3-hydroxymyristoyl)glucosamine N-acyltransferase [Elusimicrobia bacterium GWA2_61_42]OGR79959.1 MAG: UDP-3-O-(3-hydroxymyristoyl)glucosamine N-acyltransferase [Elusimicrobia bacterium GWC2_61_25]
MKLTAADIAKLAEGDLAGDGTRPISGAAPLEKAGPSDLAFVADAAMLVSAPDSKAGCLLAPRGTEGLFKDFPGTLVFTKNPKYAFMLALRLVEKEARPLPPPGVHPAAFVSPDAQIGGGAHVGPFAVIEAGAVIGSDAVIDAQCYIGRNAKVGARSRLYPGVKVLDACEVGIEVIIHAGAVIGSDGYGYISPRGTHEKIPQLGKVVIEDRVEIGANAAIDRAALEVTRIGAGTKIDNLVHIAHNVKTGQNCLIIAQAGIAGSTTLGNGVIIAGQAAVSDHLAIGDNTVVMGKTGVISSLGPNQIVFGHTARPRMQAMKIEVLLGKLPEMHRALSKIKKHLGL